MRKRGWVLPRSKPFYVNTVRGRTYYRIVVVRPGAARYRETFQFRTQGDAAKGRTRAEEILNREWWTVEEAVRQYVEHLEQCGQSSGGLATTRHRLESVFPAGTELFVGELDHGRFEDCFDLYRSSRGHALATQKSTLKTAQRFIRWLVEKGLLSADPTGAVKVTGKAQRGSEKDVLTIDQSRALFQFCQSSIDPWRGAPLLALLLGLRAGEIAQIAPGHIDDQGRVLRVAVERGKNANARRNLVLPPLLQGATSDLAQMADKTRHKVSWHVSRIWATTRAQAISKDKRAKDWPESIGPQLLRRSRATVGVVVGEGVGAVAELLGHGSTAVTKQHYVQAGTEDVAVTAGALRVLQGGAQ